MEIPEVPRVFFIRGVFKHTARSIEEIIESGTTDEQVPALLRVYEDWNESAWNLQRQVQCGTCTRVCAARAIFIPENIERCAQGHRYKCHDTVRFCSWHCAAYHIQYFIAGDRRYKLLLNHLHEQWTGVSVVEIAASQHPWRLRELGGELSMEELHRLNDFNMARLASSFQDE